MEIHPERVYKATPAQQAPNTRMRAAMGVLYENVSSSETILLHEVFQLRVYASLLCSPRLGQLPYCSGTLQSLKRQSGRRTATADRFSWQQIIPSPARLVVVDLIGDE